MVRLEEEDWVLCNTYWHLNSSILNWEVQDGQVGAGLPVQHSATDDLMERVVTFRRPQVILSIVGEY